MEAPAPPEHQIGGGGQEADLTAGHGILRVSGLISVSAPSVDELEAAVAAIEQASIQASCETR
ncbi:hypothetical protein, partial [Nocardia cyriacigeorgica]|uniref:hypothetical protein n=1 Tax=Nocardia cyriacigeorgica TaxID=135487 RepID=UPI002455A9C9